MEFEIGISETNQSAHDENDFTAKMIRKFVVKISSGLCQKSLCDPPNPLTSEVDNDSKFIKSMENVCKKNYFVENEDEKFFITCHYFMFFVLVWHL